jgi:hypothetical protein
MAPWKCPDCGTWWSGLEHRCAPTGVGTEVGTVAITPLAWWSHSHPDTSTTAVHCTCARKRLSAPETGFCLVHDIQVL